jgi:hypothetical protein
MNRQKSILSFFHKTSPENRTSGGAQSSVPSLQKTDPTLRLDAGRIGKERNSKERNMREEK